MDTTSYDIIITPGANQAFAEISSVLCESRQNVILLAPYYFSHLVCLQLTEIHITIAPFQPLSLLPQWDELERMIHSLRPTMVGLLIIIFIV